MKRLSNITLPLICNLYESFSDLIMLSSELGLLKRPTIAVIVSAVIGSYFCTSSSSFAKGHNMESCEGQGIPKRLHVACAFAIYFGDVICKLAMAFENSAGNNRA